MFAGSPSNVATVNPAHSASAASSVKSLRPSRAARRWASRITSKRNACGVCAILNRARSGVASTFPPPSTSLISNVGDLYGGNRRACSGSCLDRARNQRCRDKGSRGVVDENDVRFLGGERLQSGMHRSLTCGPPACRRLVLQLPHGLIENGDVVGIQNRLYGRHLGMSAKRFHRPENNRLAADRAVLLRSTRTCAEAASGRDEDGCSPLRFRHGISIKCRIGIATAAVVPGALPLSRWADENRTIPMRCGEKHILLHCTCKIYRTV